MAWVLNFLHSQANIPRVSDTNFSQIQHQLINTHYNFILWLKEKTTRERRKQKYHITTSLPARWQTAQHDRFFDAQVWQTWSISRYLGWLLDILKMEEEELALKYLIFKYFGVTNIRWYDILKHQKIKYLKIFKQKYLDIFIYIIFKHTLHLLYLGFADMQLHNQANELI